ncbi:hypothetical protein PspLS_08231 [Pyricularia sp. CBS 133598]|nr:hypothetical protein PspLS_08231 [Pyricularia sp. CBS 133598]
MAIKPDDDHAEASNFMTQLGMLFRRANTDRMVNHDAGEFSNVGPRADPESQAADTETKKRTKDSAPPMLRASRLRAL